MSEYIAFFEYVDGEEGYSVLFPDVPGCFSYGENYAEAVRNAHEALAFHIEALREDGEPIPQPRTLEQIKNEWEDWEEWKNSSFVVGVVKLLPLTKPKKYTLYLDSALMAQIDAVTKNRSAFLTEAAKALLQDKKAVHV